MFKKTRTKLLFKPLQYYLSLVIRSEFILYSLPESQYKHFLLYYHIHNTRYAIGLLGPNENTHTHTHTHTHTRARAHAHTYLCFKNYRYTFWFISHLWKNWQCCGLFVSLIFVYKNRLHLLIVRSQIQTFPLVSTQPWQNQAISRPLLLSCKVLLVNLLNGSNTC